MIGTLQTYQKKRIYIDEVNSDSEIVELLKNQLIGKNIKVSSILMNRPIETKVIGLERMDSTQDEKYSGFCIANSPNSIQFKDLISIESETHLIMLKEMLDKGAIIQLIQYKLGLPLWGKFQLMFIDIEDSVINELFTTGYLTEEKNNINESENGIIPTAKGFFALDLLAA